MESLKVSKYFFYTGLISAIIAVGYTAPLILGPLINPNGHNIINNGPGSILTDYTTWPALWMLFAFVFFVIVAIAGSVLFSYAYSYVSNVFGKTKTYGSLAALQLFLIIIGSYLSTSLMFYVGYDEGSKIAAGLSPIIVAGLDQWTVIPTGLGVGLASLGVLIGVINLALTIRSKQQSA